MPKPKSGESKPITNHFDVKVDTNAVSDEDGVVRFENGLTISDESEQVNGTRYDHSGTDLSKWTGEVFADHGGERGYTVDQLVGTAFGVIKESGRIAIEGIKYAMKSPLGKLYHDLLVEGHSKNFSVGTRGPEPDDNGVYKDHAIHELSQVGLGNNLSARAEGVISSALNSYEKDGMDVTNLRKIFDIQTNAKEESMADTKPVKNQDDEEKKDDAEAPADDSDEESTDSDGDTAADDGGDDEGTEDTSDEDEVDENSIKKMVENAVKPLKGELKKYKQAFDEGAKEPEWQMGGKNNAFGPATITGKTQFEKNFESMNPWEQAALQFVSFCKMEREKDADAQKTLQSANEYNLGKLKKNGLVQNTHTLSDFGNFVISPELQTEIEGFRTNYSDVLRFFNYQQTASRDFSWLTRSGDIAFEDVDGIDDAVGTDTLKPVSEYSGTVTTSRLQEMAAVTPISTTANLFAAVDLIRDAAQGYRTEADQRLAELPIARLEQAMEADATRSTSWDTGSQTTAEKFSNLRTAIAALTQFNGTLVMSEASHFLIYDLLHQAGAGSGLTESIVKGNPARSLWGRNLVVVPNDLMPTLDDASTYRSLTFVRPVAGGAPVTVTVNHGIFYLDPSNVACRTNGSLRYDLSTEASYESGGSTYSAFQRNEVLLRGSIFRGAAVKDPSRVRGVRAEAVIS